jgi:hypothetical protein
VDSWLTLLFTGALGLAAGQVGAWLQSRRDARAEQLRQQVETKRLQLQLADACDQRDRDRLHADTLEWRERRLATYLSASSAAHEMLNLAHGVSTFRLSLAVSATTDRCNSERRVLDEALDRCAVIGTNRTRIKAVDFAIASEELCRAISEFDLHLAGIHADPVEGPAEVWRLTTAAQQRRVSSQSAEQDDVQRVADLALAVDQALDEVHSKSVTWHEAARQELGVPD